METSNLILLVRFFGTLMLIFIISAIVSHLLGFDKYRNSIMENTHDEDKSKIHRIS
jgi:hypothetical protein